MACGRFYVIATASRAAVGCAATKGVSMDISFACGSCGQSIAIDEAGAGQFVDCPTCGKALEVPYKSKPLKEAPTPPSAPLPSPAPAGAKRKGQDMKTCPKCGMALYGGETCHCEQVATAETGTYKDLSARAVATFVGCLLIAAGIIMTIYFVAGYDTAVETTIPGEYNSLFHHYDSDRHERVNNIGLEANRLVGVMCGLGLTFLGGGLLIIGRLIALGEDTRRAADALEATGKIVAEQDAEWRKKSETA